MCFGGVVNIGNVIFGGWIVALHDVCGMSSVMIYVSILCSNNGFFEVVEVIEVT